MLWNKCRKTSVALILYFLDVERQLQIRQKTAAMSVSCPCQRARGVNAVMDELIVFIVILLQEFRMALYKNSHIVRHG